MNLDTSSIPKGVHGACPSICRDHRGKILTNLHMLSTIKQQVRVTSSDWTSRSRESSGNSDPVGHRDNERELKNSATKEGDSAYCTKMQTVNIFHEPKITVSVWTASATRGKKGSQGGRLHLCTKNANCQVEEKENRCDDEFFVASKITSSSKF